MCLLLCWLLRLLCWLLCLLLRLCLLLCWWWDYLHGYLCLSCLCHCCGWCWLLDDNLGGRGDRLDVGGDLFALDGCLFNDREDKVSRG